MGYVSALMFAGNDFFYNTDPQEVKSAEPRTGFTIIGNFAAMNHVSLLRDWYSKAKTCKTEGQSCSSDSQCCSGNCRRSKCTAGSAVERRPSEYNSTTGQWFDAKTGTVLTSTQIGTMTHYQMIVNYDERVRNENTCPPGLPRGGKKIFAGFSNWEEL
jgi:hypothetical protein